MEEKKYNKDFEFALFLNEHIIVKRNFDIIGFNYKGINSNNFKEAIDYIVNMIKADLRNKSIQYMCENINNFYDNPKFDSNESNDVIIFQVKHKNKLIANRTWDATIYPGRIRYTVNIRDHIYEIITKIQKTLSTKNVNTKYLGYELA